MYLGTVALLLSATAGGLSASVAGRPDRRSDREPQQVIGGTGSVPLVSPAGAGADAAAAFTCDLPPAVLPGDDGLPSAEELFSGPAALKKQVERHAALVQVPSVSFDAMADPYEDPRWEVFLELHSLLEELYPAVHARMNRTKVNRLGLVYTIAGSEPSLKPLMLTAHQDVVPVADASTWSHPPFSGYFDGAYLWGRGACDDKNSLTALLSTLEALFAAEPAWTPRRAIVLALGFDEEASGHYGAGSIATYLEARYGADSMVMIVDEGAGMHKIGNTVFAVPSVMEKGHVDVLYELHVSGGHSSMPFPHTGIGIVAEIVTALESNPYAPQVLPGSPIHHSYICKARYEPDAEPEITKLVRSGDLAKLAEALASIDRDIHFRLQTSQAVDIIVGGVKINAMPELTTLGVNYRVAPQDSIEGVKQKTVRLVEPIVAKYGLTLQAFGQPAVDGKALRVGDLAGTADLVKPLYTVDYNGTLVLTSRQETQPAPMAPTSGAIWDLFSGTIQSTFAASGDHVVPVGDMMNGNTDTRHYLSLTRNIYRFQPSFGCMNVHTVDERVEMEDHVGMVKFYYNLIRNFDASDV